MGHRWGNSGTVADSIFGGLQNHCRWWLQSWNQKVLTPLKESCDHPRQHIQKQRYYFVKKGPSSQGYGFSSGHLWMWELDYKESWVPKNWWFWTVELEKTLESYITHLQGTSVAQDPTQVAPPASSRHPLLGTPSPAWATWLALLCFSENPVRAPWRCTTLLAYAIFLAVSRCHQVGGGQRWCFISLCCPSLWAGCGGWWTIFVDHRKQGGRKKTDTIYDSGIGVAITEFLTI